MPCDASVIRGWNLAANVPYLATPQLSEVRTLLLMFHALRRLSYQRFEPCCSCSMPCDAAVIRGSNLAANVPCLATHQLSEVRTLLLMFHALQRLSYQRFEPCC
ncbi:hypothetical protein RRG08_055144 [Elysia crispata]|uniref:Uncharacterized protein n=1 Tax=Elysia crispata TaxID=231223 RepID=A0AAE0Y1V3_9GAST|nr:hypothetical protein RRG08_055144 [Elysia crispata]